VTRAQLQLAGVFAATLAGCLEDHYTCTTNGDCNVGIAGRCELDHHCTQYDGTCPLQRRYSPHSGGDTGQCFTDTSAPLDPCAAGQIAGDTSDACARAVCTTVPSCCTTSWSEPCVQEAQRQCQVRCDTRIAVMAERGPLNAPTEVALYDLRFDGVQWTVTPHPELALLSWLAPSPGSTEPRLASITRGVRQLVIGDRSPLMYAIPDLDYDSATTVDLLRSGRDTAMIASYDSTNRRSHELVDLTTGELRDFWAGNSPAESWGDYDGDAFPDGVAASGGSQQFHFLINSADPNQVRILDDTVSATTNPGPNPVRSFAWTELDASGRLALVQFGADIQVHLAPSGGNKPLRNTPSLRLDCEPVVVFPTAPACTSTNQDTYAFAGTTVPTSHGTYIVASVDNTTPNVVGKPSLRSRNMYRLLVGFGPAALKETVAIPFQPTCSGASCPPIRAVVARDLDSDGILDLVAIDAALAVWVSMGHADDSFAAFTQVASLPDTSWFPEVRVSVSGALR
jgi:hypothetical protein